MQPIRKVSMPAKLYSNTELGMLQLSDVSVSSKGTRSCAVLTEGGKLVVLRLPELRAPIRGHELEGSAGGDSAEPQLDGRASRTPEKSRAA